MISSTSKVLTRPALIINQQLTSSFVAVTIPADLRFDSYVVNTQDNSDWEMKLNSTDTAFFKFSQDAYTSPINTDFDKRAEDLNPTLFHAKGTGVLQILFLVS